MTDKLWITKAMDLNDSLMAFIWLSNVMYLNNSLFNNSFKMDKSFS